MNEQKNNKSPRSKKIISLLIGANAVLLLFFILAIGFLPTQAASLAENLKGRILLQVEQHGEAWYINPVDNKRYYLGRPDDAFQIMRNFGLGITDNNLNQIPTGSIEQVCCESYALGSGGGQYLQEFGWSYREECVISEKHIGGGKIIVDSSYCPKK